MPRISGSRVTLRPARESDRADVYRWLAKSDVTASMMGQPTYPDAPVPTWEEFCADYGPHFFDGSQADVETSYIIEVAGDAVGHVNYQITRGPEPYAELDIWLRSEADTGHGYGPDALVALSNHLAREYGVCTSVLRPSARNSRAIRAYQKAGFVLEDLSTQQQAKWYGAGDYTDTVILVRHVSA